MTWQVRFHLERPDFETVADRIGERMIGVLYPVTAENRPFLSPHYREHVAAVRPPLVLMVPAFWPDSPDSLVAKTPGGFRLGAQPWCIDSAPSNDANGGWTVECPWPLEDGQDVALTIHPSLNCVGSYHGWIKDGVISADVEGRW